MGKVKLFLKDWALVISMLCGAAAYLIYHSIPALHFAGPSLLRMVKTVQPFLLFAMLFLSFCKIEPRAMKPRRVMVPMLLVQCLGFALTALVILLFPSPGLRVPMESFMLCLICPTATACAVVTSRLGGDMAFVVTYTVLINLAVALLVPLVVPVLYPAGGVGFLAAFLKILSKVFPLLIMPALLAWLIRAVSPRLLEWCIARSDLSFNIWVIGLMLAILMSVRAIVHSSAGVLEIGLIALASLLACVLQFASGRLLGARTGNASLKISSAQSLGQKNTVFAIWMGYTFLDPLTSVAGGFYSIWHNVYNSIQLRRKNHEVQA